MAQKMTQPGIMTADRFWNPADRAASATGGLFDAIDESRGPDKEPYDGTGGDTVRVQRPVAIHFGQRDSVLGNPDAIYGADGFTRGHALMSTFARTMRAGDQASVRLFRELAKQGQRAAMEAKDRGQSESAWTAVGQTLEEASVGRAAVLAALAQAPAKTNVERQKLPRRAEEIDLARFEADMIENAGLATTRRRVHDPQAKPSLRLATREDRDNGDVTHAGMIGVVCARGREEDAAAYMAGLDPRLVIAATPHKALSEAMARHGIDRARTVHNPVPRGETGGKAMGSFLGAVDKVAVIGEDDRTTWIAAEATRAGKLGRVIDNTGADRDVIEAGLEATRQHASWRDRKRAESVSSLTMRASDPEGRLLLSLISAKSGVPLSSQDIDALADIGEPITTLADQAATQQGKEYLRDEHRIPPRAIALLKEEEALDDAKKDFTRIMAQTQAHGVTVLAPRDFPEKLRTDPDRPAVLFAQGNLDLLRGAGLDAPAIAMVGETPRQDFDRRIAASAMSQAIAGISESGATFVRAEDALAVTPKPADTQQILVLASGVAHGSDRHKQDRQSVLDAGGVVVSAYPPEETGSYIAPKEAAKKGLDKFARLPKPSTANEATQRAAVTVAAGLANETVIGAMDARKPSSLAHRAVEASLLRNREPVILRPNDEGAARELSGNRAMLSGRGAEALARAGVSIAVIEAVAGKGKPFENAPVAVDTGGDPRAAMKTLAGYTAGQIPRADLEKTPEARPDRMMDVHA